MRSRLLRRPAVVAAAIAVAVAPVPARPQDTTGLPGFTAGHAAAQRRLEARFLAVPSATAAEADARALTGRPHLSGTPGAAWTAAWLAEELRRLGFEVEIETYEPWLPHPGRVRVDIVYPAPRALNTREPLPAHDASHLDADAAELTAWHAYSANGRAEGEVVYANYGLPADYAELERLGIDVRGRIVLARLGRSYRGVKADQAESRGAVALLLFPDPSGDGWAAGDTLPAGPFRPAWSVQRGTTAYMWRYTGDPLTPGRPARPGVPRLEPAQATNLPRIPVVPLPYGEAERLLRELGGPDAPVPFRGAMDVTYRPGPGPVRVRVEVELDYAFRPVRNVIARLPGRTSQEVVIGNHYDAWILGGVDPHTGTAATLQIARGLAALKAGGWQPRRGITLGFWDAEEYGVVGSTEWVEDHAAELAANAVAYFNVDMFTAGVLDVSGSPALRDLVVSAADDVRDPLTGRALSEHWRERQARAAADAGNPQPQKPDLGDIGAGSDWTAFLYFVGVPSLQWTMNGRGTYGVYHSVLDDFEYYRRFADSAFVHTPALAQVMGLAALRLLEADALPFRYSHYAERIAGHIRAVESAHGVRLDEERAAAERLLARAASFERAQAAALEQGRAAQLARSDAEVQRVEQALLDPAGLPGRPWYRHGIYAPGADTGYDPLPLAPLVEALQARDPPAFDRARSRLREALERATRTLEAARARLDPPSRQSDPASAR